MGEIPEVKPVKLGEGPERQGALELTPSQAPVTCRGRCREQTAGTYGSSGTCGLTKLW